MAEEESTTTTTGGTVLDRYNNTQQYIYIHMNNNISITIEVSSVRNIEEQDIYRESYQIHIYIERDRYI